MNGPPPSALAAVLRSGFVPIDDVLRLGATCRAAHSAVGGADVSTLSADSSALCVLRSSRGEGAIVAASCGMDRCVFAEDSPLPMPSVGLLSGRPLSSLHITAGVRGDTLHPGGVSAGYFWTGRRRV